MTFPLFLIILFLLIVSYQLGRKRRHSRFRKLLLSRHYFVGLNYLLNEQTDKAVDIFTRMVDVDNETLETHVAIGSLFRRRGEVDRAIHIHQNILTKTHLTKSIHVQALLELGRDYMQAGLYDRAERLFLEALDMDGAAASSGLKNLLIIYQYEKEWLKAIEYAKLLQKKMHEDTRKQVAQYFCELIEEEWVKLTDWQFQEYLKKIFEIDKNCVRASLLEARWYTRHGDLKSAIKAYKRVKEQDVTYLSETIQPITLCFTQLEDEIGLRDYLYFCLNESPHWKVILTIAEKLKEWQTPKVAADFIVDQLQSNPSLLGVKRLLSFYREESTEIEQTRFKILEKVIDHFLNLEENYQCQHCGFNTKQLTWLCPGCKHWSTIKLVDPLFEQIKNA